MSSVQNLKVPGRSTFFPLWMMYPLALLLLQLLPVLNQWHTLLQQILRLNPVPAGICIHLQYIQGILDIELEARHIHIIDVTHRTLRLSPRPRGL